MRCVVAATDTPVFNISEDLFGSVIYFQASAVIAEQGILGQTVTANHLIDS